MSDEASRDWTTESTITETMAQQAQGLGKLSSYIGTLEWLVLVAEPRMEDHLRGLKASWDLEYVAEEYRQTEMWVRRAREVLE